MTLPAGFAWGAATSAYQIEGTHHADGVIDDRRRIAYLDAHIAAVEAAAAQGVPMIGYFAWSLLDNLEWTSGDAQRFGLVWVDHETQQRIPEASAHWYGERIARA